MRLALQQKITTEMKLAMLPLKRHIFLLGLINKMPPTICLFTSYLERYHKKGSQLHKFSRFPIVNRSISFLRHREKPRNQWVISEPRHISCGHLQMENFMPTSPILYMGLVMINLVNLYPFNRSVTEMYSLRDGRTQK